MEQSKKRELLITLAVLVAIALIVGGVLFIRSSPEEENSALTTESTQQPRESQTPAATDTPAAETPADSVAAYKDGTYTATGNYSTPEGSESITVNITLSGDKVTATSATASMKSRDSKEYASAFIENYQSQVVGKSLDDISLNRVSGSSLTPQGFNSAIEKIKDQAEV